jgi:hypothetical protein
MPSVHGLVVEFAAVVASGSPSSGEVGPRAIGRKQEFGPTNPDTSTRFLVCVISIELFARYPSQPPMLGQLPQSIDSQQFTSHYERLCRALHLLARLNKLQCYRPLLERFLSLPFLNSIVLGLRSRKKLSAQVGRTEIINVRVGERHRFKASLKASSLATARSIASLAQSINSCSGSSSQDCPQGLLICCSARIFAPCLQHCDASCQFVREWRVAGMVILGSDCHGLFSFD